MSIAFAGTRIQTVKLINTDNITYLADAYKGCTHLAVVPPLKFKKITSLLALTTTGILEDIFDGCTTLHNSEFTSDGKDVGLDAVLADVEEYYKSK